MLAGLFFLGFIAAASLPDIMEVVRGSDNGSDDDHDEQDNDAPDMIEFSRGDAAFAPSQTAEESIVEQDTVYDDTVDVVDSDAAMSGADLFVQPRAGITLVEDFKVGTDTLTLAIPDEAQEFSTRDADDDGPAMLTFDVADGAVEVHFEGLQTVPVDDIFLRVSDAASPTLDADIALSNLIETESDPGDPTVGQGVLDPVDPELPDDPPTDPGEGPVLDPVDPELPDEPAPPFDGGTVLFPVEDDADLSGDGADLAALIERDGGNATGFDGDVGELTVLGGGGDAVNGPSHDDPGRLNLSQAMPQVSAGAEGAPAIDLGQGNDAFVGGTGAVYSFGGEGDDVLSAGDGASALFGGAGDDVLDGAAGENGAARVLLHGGDGNDVITGGSAAEYLDGGEHGATVRESGAMDGPDLGRCGGRRDPGRVRR